VLFRKDLWPRIADGSVTVAFRRWRRPTVRTGGTLRSPAGLLSIEEVRQVDVDSLRAADARRAGHRSLDDLRAELGPPDPARSLYRIAFRRGGEDPREALRRRDRLDDVEVTAVRRALARSDRAVGTPWTWSVLGLIAEHPGVVARELAPRVGMDRDTFKARVRRLKALGLTESLHVGYRLSPRGRALLRAGPAAER